MALVDAAIDNIELTKAGINMPQRNNAVSAAYDKKQIDSGDSGGYKSARRGNRNMLQKYRLKYKPDTREITLEMFNSGKTIQNIAAERSLKISTIRGHLAHWIEEGEADIEQLMSKDTLDEIISAFKETENPSLSSVKKRLNHKYDYSMLKLSVAFLRRQKWEDMEQ